MPNADRGPANQSRSASAKAVQSDASTKNESHLEDNALESWMVQAMDAATD